MVAGQLWLLSQSLEGNPNMSDFDNEENSKWTWSEFNKNNLRDIVSKETGLSGGKLENESGIDFE